jgi:type IV pilus assembly protein PilE
MKNKGFSLIELLVVLGILLLLAGIAIPAYNQYRIKSLRSAARAYLIEAAQTLERHFVRNNTYATATIATGGTLEPTAEGGLYTIAWSAGPTQNTYTLQATAGGGQAGDTACPSLTINHLGAKLPAACW